MIAVLHNKRRKLIQRRHPWVYSRAIRRFYDDPGPGDIVTLVSEEDEFIARGMWNPRSDIRMRILTWLDEPIDEQFWDFRLRQALMLRGLTPEGEARRIINAENDYLPGLIVDQYGEWLVLQSLAMGMEAHKFVLAEMLADILKPKGIYERSDADVRAKEGLEPVVGDMIGKPVPELVEIMENGYRFLVDIHHGHKTGFYLDQRENRALLAYWMLPGARVLNAFAYSGGFGVYATGAGAGEVISVDSSLTALELATRNYRLNKLGTPQTICADVFEILREYRDVGEQFDMIVLDPPKFAKSARQVEQATRGYKDINLLALQLLRPGGLLMTFSCSGAVSADLFRKVVFGALEDSGREAQVIQQLEAPPDHPVALTFPEGVYLKGLLCHVL